jgi:AcrR family transcriptional regulator
VNGSSRGPGGPDRGESYRFVLAEEIIKAKVGALFPGHEVEHAYAFRLTRNADIEIAEDEADDLLQVIEDEVRKRRWGDAVRLEATTSMPASVSVYVARGVARRERILDAALDVFARHGYNDSAVDQIAADAATSKGGVYFHFPGKQAIFLALLDRTAALLEARALEAMAAAPDPVARLDAALLVVVRTFEARRPLARLFLVEAMGAGREFNAKMLETHGRFVALIRSGLDRAVAEGVIGPLDTELAARAWFGALNEVVTVWALSEQPGSLEARYPALRALLLRSVGASEPPHERAPR